MELGKIKLSLVFVLFIIALIAITIMSVMIITHNQTNKENETAKMQNNTTINNNVTSNKIQNTSNNTAVEKNNKYVIDTTKNNIQYEKYITTNGIDGMYVTEVIDNKNDTYTLKGIKISKFRMDLDKLEDLLKEDKVELRGKEYRFKETESEESPYVLEPVKEEKGDYNYYINKVEENVYELNRAVQLQTVYVYIEEAYTQITVKKDMLIEDEYSGESNVTVEEQFKNLQKEDLQLTKEELEDDKALDTSRTFQFETDEEGNCLKIIDLITQI